MVGKIPFEHLEFEIPRAKLLVLQIPEKQKKMGKIQILQFDGKNLT